MRESDIQEVPTLVVVTMTVNGQIERRSTEPRRNLADFLRYDLGLTGTHLGCEQGACGACTVIVDDRAVRSCLMLAVQAEGTSVRTVEGLAVGYPDRGAADAQLHPLQQAFWDHQALQCSFCTPGFLMTALAALEEEPDLRRNQLRERLGGTLCRCTGYESIIDAVTEAAAVLRERGDQGDQDRGAT